MKTNAIIIHGCVDKVEYLNPKYPSPSNLHWLGWLQKELLRKNILTQTPEMPTPYHPKYQDWKRIIEQFHIDKNTILIGHSCGGGFLLRWLSECEKKINKLILVAPYLDPHKTKKDFLKFEINPKLNKLTNEIHILLSNDTESIKTSVEKIIKEIPSAKLHLLKNMGHFCLDQMKTQKFPKLLKLVLK